MLYNAVHLWSEMPWNFVVPNYVHFWTTKIDVVKSLLKDILWGAPNKKENSVDFVKFYKTIFENCATIKTVSVLQLVMHFYHSHFRVSAKLLLILLTNAKVLKV